MHLLDTNLLIRYLTDDDPAKAAAVLALLQQVRAGRERLMTTEVVVAEVTFVLSSPRSYNLPNHEITARLDPVLRLRGLVLPRKRVILRALAIYGANRRLDFSDALLIATAEQTGITTIYSYDTDFDGITDITRLEP